MPMYDHYFSNFGRPFVPDNLWKDSAIRHSEFWRRRFLKVFTIYGHGGHLDQRTVTILAIFRPTDPVSNTLLCYFLSVKMQNKKLKHRPSTKYLYFHKITGPTLFFSGENRNKKFLLPTDQNFFQHVSRNSYFSRLTPLGRSTDIGLQVGKASYPCSRQR